MKSTKQLHHKLIKECVKNNAKAQMQLYNLYCSAMFLVAKRYVKDEFLAEDVMQDAFIKAFKNIASYKGEVSFGSWLKRIVINQSIDELKKKKLSLISLNEEVVNVAEEGEEDNWKVGNEVSANVVMKVIETLKEKYKVVLTLYLLEGYDHQEISQIVGITEVTSRTNLLRGKKILKEQLKSICYAERY
ncbi:RNA polymerase sigma-70 factor (ECF subfamily) [Tenacibaculum adriaticum]|uniref:RNA polymerase sigma-70 factor (ECF subfamily) n=1 Tax=Tenacibaculum adriaticum TaxID=413713 RepID=A0A5S5DM27_9FLAO|nr:sigma-70 family RNA polymerase sigma factor [Tenacibaculum adriaticum]TYP96096.1 RNA polymerase sigma-70 factor (ECF subfamily) [Tenacibaculum adriaticum]